jgi:ADP-ribose pyrophosphatase YjhB (NUDIX family)
MIQIGGIYEHYKGHRYEVIGLAKHSETLEDLVVYKNIEAGEMWSRPASMFEQMVVIESASKPRFKLIADSNVALEAGPVTLTHDLKRGRDFIGVTVVFYCHDGQGRILMHKRSARCRDEQGAWDCGGGSMEFGETFEDTVKREIFEEYGVQAEDLRLVKAQNVIREHNGKMTHWVSVLFVVRVDPDQVKIGDPEKMDEIGWFLESEFPEPLHSSLMKDMQLIHEAGINI